MTIDTRTPEHLTHDDVDSVRHAVRVYIESLGYQDMGGDGSGDSSVDDEGLYGLQTFRNPITGKTLFVELKIGEEDPEEPAAA